MALSTHSIPAAHATVYALRSASAHTERAIARALEPFGITAAQFELLDVIGRHSGDGAACSELARQLVAPGPDITRMLDRLHTAGLVSRSRDANDRRVVHTMLTTLGEEMLHNASPAVQVAEAALFAGLADDQRALLTGLLDDIRRNCADR